MRIALFHNMPSGGAKRFVYNQVRELARRVHEIIEFTTSVADRSYLDLQPYVSAQRVYDFAPPPFSSRRIPILTPYLPIAELSSILRLTQSVNQLIAQEIDAGQFDLALAADCRIMPMPYVLRYLGTPSVFQCHHVPRAGGGEQRDDDWGDSHVMAVRALQHTYYAPARAISRHIPERNKLLDLRAATCVSTDSDYSRSDSFTRSGVAAQVIYPGINTELFCSSGAPKEDFVSAVGEVQHRRGYRFLVSALALLPEARRPALVVAANSADSSEQATVMEMASRVGVILRIEHFRDDRRMVHLYDAACACVYAAIEEALGLAPLEAMACASAYTTLARHAYGAARDMGRARGYLARALAAWPPVLTHVDWLAWLGRALLGYRTVQSLKLIARAGGSHA